MDIKELLKYIFSKFKFWVIIKEWESGVHLRKGKIKRTVNQGIYIRIPIIDSYYSQPNKTQAIQAIQINVLSQGKEKCISGSVWYRIDNIKDYYTSYSEPNEVISDNLRSAMVKTYHALNGNESIKEIESLILSRMDKNKGVKYESFQLTTLSNAKTYRIIKDSLYSQDKNLLDNAIE